MSERLSEWQNAVVGLSGGAIEVTAMQSTNYWKNAAQQGLPFTADPRKLYRGYPANLTCMCSVTVFQFVANGYIKKMMTGGESRPLTTIEQLGAGFAAGFSSSLLCGPLELAMIQQQRKGGSLASTASSLVGGGHVTRGVTCCAMREGVYTAGYLGVGPVIRTSLADMGYSNAQAAVAGAVLGGSFCCFLSHPFDTVKTLMQGDVERGSYTTATKTLSKLVKERGVSGLYSGAGWRLTRQIGAVFILDQSRVLLSPLLFPEQF
jgi:hypothetical protein